MYSLDDKWNLFVGLIIIEMLPNGNEKYIFTDFSSYRYLFTLYFRFRNRPIQINIRLKYFSINRQKMLPQLRKMLYNHIAILEVARYI